VSFRPAFEEVSLRRMEPADANAVWQLTRRVPEASQWSETDYLRAAAAPFSSWVALLSGSIVGFLVSRTAAGEMEILSLAVDAAQRLRGLATRLLSAAREDARHLGAHQAFLEVRPSNQAAIAFYSGVGFRVSGRRKDYYSDPREDALVMVRELD
jgi:ribosomal-protein-alanine acetyltransferase